MFSVIAACSLNGGIGKNNSIPWYVPDDLKHFRNITSSCPSGFMNAVIMGKNTWYSLPKKPLPNRINIVVSKSLLEKGGITVGEHSTVHVVPSLDAAIELVSRLSMIHSTFVIGGSALYNEALCHPNCKKVFITHILKYVECDVFFPMGTLFKAFPSCTEGSINRCEDLHYTFCTYERD
jgi:dihydrofolate reductase